MKKAIPWILVVIPAFVFLQSLPFKFTGAAETQHIFGTIGSWFGTIGLGFLADPFTNAGAVVFGAIEALAAVLLLVPRTRHVGALLGLALLTGAIFFHVATPLGVAVTFPGTTEGDPTLFVMAVVGWLCCAATIYLNRDRYSSTSAVQP